MPGLQLRLASFAWPLGFLCNAVYFNILHKPLGTAGLTASKIIKSSNRFGVLFWACFNTSPLKAPPLIIDSCGCTMERRVIIDFVGEFPANVLRAAPLSAALAQVPSIMTQVSLSSESPPPERRGSAPSAVAEELPRRRRRTVSYTHLTLPTIREV